MSCITKLLEIKGDKEFIVNGSIAIEGGGVYKGHEYLITFVSNGYRCGYVAIDENNKLFSRYDDNEIALQGIDDDIGEHVHGGITFFDHGTHVLKGFVVEVHCTDKWIGFDAGHGHDEVDKENVKKYFNKDNEDSDYLIKFSYLLEALLGKDFGEKSMKNHAFMENECKKLIDKVIELGNKNEA